MAQESNVPMKSKIMMIKWVCELIDEINMIDKFFMKKQEEYRNEFLELKQKFLRYQKKDTESNVESKSFINMSDEIPDLELKDSSVNINPSSK